MELKRCPTCHRTYSDEALSFCLVDGSILSAPYDPEATLLMPESRGVISPPTEVVPAGRITDENLPATVPAAPQGVLPASAKRLSLTKAQVIQEQEQKMAKLVLGLIISLLLVVFIVILVNSN